MQPAPKTAAPSTDAVNLDAVIADLWKKAPTDQRTDLHNFMAAATKVKEMALQQGMMAQAAGEIKSAQDIPRVVAQKVRKLINVVTVHGAKKFVPSSLYAAQILAVQALRLIQAQYNIPITKPILAQTIQLTVQQVSDMFGLNNPQLLQQLKAQREQGGAAKSSPNSGPQNTPSESPSGALAQAQEEKQ